VAHDEQYQDGRGERPVSPQLEMTFREKGVPRARTSDVATSHAAAASMRSVAKSQHAAIVWCLEGHGPLTYWQIAQHLGWEPVKVARRLAELRELGQVERLPETRDTPTGRQAHLHKAVR